MNYVAMELIVHIYYFFVKSVENELVVNFPHLHSPFATKICNSFALKFIVL